MGMVVFSDKKTEYIEKVQETFRAMGRKAEIIVLEDDGFLPEGTSSPYEFFAYKDHQGELAKKELFYNFLELPLFWEVRLIGDKGAVFDMGCEKARIYFKEPVENRNVLRVEWHTEDGWIYRVDRYNRYGLRYMSEFLDPNGKIDSKVYYSVENQERVAEQPKNQIISLLVEGELERCFASWAEFIEYYRREAGLGENCILMVENEESFQRLELASDKRNRWKQILFSDKALLDRYITLGGAKRQPAVYDSERISGEPCREGSHDSDGFGSGGASGRPDQRAAGSGVSYSRQYTGLGQAWQAGSAGKCQGLSTDQPQGSGRTVGPL